jgi:hypothetical protein
LAVVHVYLGRAGGESLEGPDLLAARTGIGVLAVELYTPPAEPSTCGLLTTAFQE